MRQPGFVQATLQQCLAGWFAFWQRQVETGGAPMVEMNVLASPGNEEFTRIAFFRNRGFRKGRQRASIITLDTGRSSELPDVQSRAPETAPVLLGGNETLKLRVFVDRSVVEVFVNGKQCVAARVYPGRADSTGSKCSR